jgi:hypothetical protein
LLEIWKNLTLELAILSPDEFRNRIIPMALHPFNPDDHPNPEIKTLISSAWQSLADAPVFQTILKNLVSENRDIRFKSISELAGYGAFAIWICLYGLNSQSWHLRRNLATVMGQIVDVRQTNLLREPLRDHDWHVRLEIVKALAERTDEIKELIKLNPDHPIIKIVIMALRDGNRSIRSEAYKPIENLQLVTAFRSLAELFQRLAAVNSDSDIEERVKIIRLCGVLASFSCTASASIIEFLSEVGSQPEGLITPNWMIPIKKAVVEALSSLDYPLAVEKLTMLATQKPFKRGVVGREARAALQRLEKK